MGIDLDGRYKCIIIDDASYAVEGLKQYISAIPELVLVKSYTDPVLALLELVSSEPVDLIFLDINMPQISGIELSKEIRHITKKLVFTTAHTKYAYEAFEVSADAYLLKPYTLTKFASTITKLFPKEFVKQTGPEQHDFFFVKDSKDNLKIVKIKYMDVIVVESRQNYVMIHTQSRGILTYMSLTEISAALNQHSTFVQFHRSYIIGKKHIDSIDGNTITMDNGIKITVGKYYHKDFAAFLSTTLIKAARKN